MRLTKHASAEEFFAKYGRRFSGASPKHARLRMILQAALDDGLWNEGDTIFTEHQIARASACSVGTVQRAIRDLVGSGDLKRVAGRGTFVTRGHYRLDEPFTNTRFLNDDGTGIVPVRASLLSKVETTAAGPWMQALNPPDGTLLRIERLFDVNGEFRVLSRFYFDSERFARVARLPAAKLKSANLKRLIARTYGLPAITHRQTLRFVAFPKEVRGAIGAARTTVGLLESVTATIAAADAVYYHELYIPPNARALELPSSSL